MEAGAIFAFNRKKLSGSYCLDGGEASHVRRTHWRPTLRRSRPPGRWLYRSSQWVREKSAGSFPEPTQCWLHYPPGSPSCHRSISRSRAFGVGGISGTDPLIAPHLKGHNERERRRTLIRPPAMALIASSGSRARLRPVTLELPHGEERIEPSVRPERHRLRDVGQCDSNWRNGAITFMPSSAPAYTPRDHQTCLVVNGRRQSGNAGMEIAAQPR